MPTKRQRKQVLGSIVVGLLVIALTLGLAYVRTKFIETRNAEEALFGGVKLDQVAISAFFFAFNLLFLAAAAWMAALRHDPDADYESLYNQYRNARERALECKKARDTNRQHYLADAQDWVGVCRRLVALYRENNLNARNSKATPRAWLMHPLDELIGIDEHQFELQLSTDIGLLQDEPDTKLFESTTEEAQNVEAVGVPT